MQAYTVTQLNSLWRCIGIYVVYNHSLHKGFDKICLVEYICGSALFSFFKLLLVNEKWCEFVLSQGSIHQFGLSCQLLETPLLTDITNMEFFVHMHMVYVILVKKTISMVYMSISLHATQRIIFLLIKSGYLVKFQIDLLVF